MAHADAESKSGVSRYALTWSHEASQPSPAAEEMKPMAEPFGSMPPASIRWIRWRCPAKLIFSMLGVPSATPAHAMSACTGPPHSSTAASMESLSARLI